MNQRADAAMSTFGAMTLAAMVGAAAALLFAPRKGSETREQIRQQMNQAKQKSREKMEAMKSKAHGGLDKAAEKTGEVQDIMSEASTQLQDTVAEPQTRNRRGTSAL